MAEIIDLDKVRAGATQPPDGAIPGEPIDPICIPGDTGGTTDSICAIDFGGCGNDDYCVIDYGCPPKDAPCRIDFACNSGTTV